MANRRLAVVGHPLAAEENRLAFAGWRGFDVDLIVPSLWRSRSLGHDYRAPEASAGTAGVPTLHPLPVIASGRNSLFVWKGLRPLLERIKPDILYCWEEPWCLATRQVIGLASGLGIPVVFYTAENRPKRLPWPFTGILRSTFAHARGCISPTREIAARIKGWGYPGPVSVVPLWIRPRRSLAASPERRTLAYVGRLIPLKRVDLLVEAIALLPDFRLRVIGDGPERAALVSLAARRGVAERIDFQGHVDNLRLESALEGASLLVLPTGENARQAEQFGKAAVEGVTCGLPVLASRTGNLASLAGDFPTLRAADLDTPARVAAEVSSIFRDYPAPEALQAARCEAESRFGPAAAARGLEVAFTACLDGRP